MSTNDYGYSQYDLSNVVSVKFLKMDAELTELESITINDCWLQPGIGKDRWQMEAYSEGGFNGRCPVNDFVERVISEIRDGYSWIIEIKVEKAKDLKGIVRDNTDLNLTNRAAFSAIFQALEDRISDYSGCYFDFPHASDYFNFVEEKGYISGYLDEKFLGCVASTEAEYPYSLDALIGDIVRVKDVLTEWIYDIVEAMECNGILVDNNGELDLCQLYVNEVSETNNKLNKEAKIMNNRLEVTTNASVTEGIEFTGEYTPGDKGYINSNECPFNISVEMDNGVDISECFTVLIDRDGRMGIDGRNCEEFPRFLSHLEDYEFDIGWNQSYSGNSEIMEFLKETEKINPDMIFDIMGWVGSRLTDTMYNIRKDDCNTPIVNIYKSLKYLRDDIKEFYETLNDYIDEFTNTFDEYCYVNSEGLYDYNFNM